MNIGVFKKYLLDKIADFSEKLKIIDERNKLYDGLEDIIAALEENITTISDEALTTIIRLVASEDFTMSRINEIKKIYPYWNLMDDEKKRVISDYIKAFVNKIRETQAKNRENNNSEKEAILVQIKTYEEYSALMDDERIIKPISSDNFASFMEFLNEVELDHLVKQQLILEFYDYNIKFYKREEQIKKNIVVDEIKTKASVIAKELRQTKEVETLDIEGLLEQIRVNAKEDEVEVINQIIGIYKKLKVAAVVSDNELIKEFLKDNFTVQDHIDTWSFESDLKRAMLTDLTIYLIPNFNTHSKEIIEIFKSLITVYASIEKSSEKEEIIKLSEEDKAFIEDSEFYVLKQAERFADLPEKEKNVLISMNDAILRGKSEEAKMISPNYSLLEVTLYGKILEYNKQLSFLREVINNAEEYISSFGLEDVQKDINMYLENLKQITLEIKKNVTELQEELYGKNTLENANNSLNNIVIFPYNGKKILEDMNAISVEDDYKETLPRVSAAIDKMTLTDANTLFAITEDIKPPKFWGNTDRFIQQSWENNTIRRLRNGDIRFGFITVGVSPSNMEYLKEKYGYDKNNRVYLLYTLFYKTGDNMDYNKANNEFVVQFEEINKILTIFGTDFDEEYLKELYNNKTKDKQIKIEYLKRMFGINEITVDSLRMAQLRAIDEIINNSQDLIVKIQRNDEELLTNGGDR